MKIRSSSTAKTVLLIISLLSALCVYSEERAYLCEIGVQGGLGYYVGDATRHIFMHVQPAYGAQFRYKFDSRWAIQLKGQGATIKYPLLPEFEGEWSSMATNGMMNIDVVGEFNFFRFGAKQYDSRIKPITPYIFIGVGVSAYSDFRSWGAYLPFGFGMKWKFAKRWGLNIAWQQQIYFADNLENKDYYNNTYNLNGSNILNNDFTSTLTLGIVFEFAKEKAVCRTCGN
ncbi:MAG: DUF6089 family protein [Paludibacter sp.]|nr:DUF6089 family protein [Bacteroidales bacterium]MCM1069755.1 DUF6089 family protein [Prevotella sp.]MCM1354440.1 DUF6089 family protein [Bacteroides sp.]MCM1443222.1 DUF6089 family protein [Muribaculum sp.]MCM1482474.1 DUF6089 family protein [Paludibacter sp.]